jgi:hypothetical protein
MVSTVMGAEMDGNIYNLGKTILSKVEDQESNGE